MKRKRSSINILLLMVAMVLSVACSEKHRGGMLSPAKLEAVLYDYHLAQVIVSDLPSSQRYKKDLYFNYVYDKHGVTAAEVDSSLVYYARYPEGLSEIYANLSKRIENELLRMENEDKPIKAREAISVVGDSVDLWYDTRLLQLSSSPLANSRYTFIIPIDTNFKAGDHLTWSGKAIFLQDRVDSLHRYLHLNLKVKYMNDSIASADTILHTSGNFSITVSDTSVVKTIYGTAYLKSSDAAERLLIVTPSIVRTRSSNDSLVVDSSVVQQQVDAMNEARLLKSADKLQLQIAHE